MAKHQSFATIEVTDGEVKLGIHLWDLAASLATASAVADREGMTGTAERLMRDAVLLRKLSTANNSHPDRAVLTVPIASPLTEEL